MSSRPTHPCLCHQGQLYCATQVRCRTCSPELCRPMKGGTSSPDCCSQLGGRGREGRASLPHPSLPITDEGQSQLSYVHALGASTPALWTSGCAAQANVVSGDTPDQEHRNICLAFGGNLSHRHGHRPQLQQDHRHRHSCWWLPQVRTTL